jgi:hypothetical protein
MCDNHLIRELVNTKLYPEGEVTVDREMWSKHTSTDYKSMQKYKDGSVFQGEAQVRAEKLNEKRCETLKRRESEERGEGKCRTISEHTQELCKMRCTEKGTRDSSDNPYKKRNRRKVRKGKKGKR